MSPLELLQGDRRLRSPERPVNLAPTAAGVLAIALVTAGLLALVGSPADSRDRLDAARSRIAAMETAAQESQGISPYPAGAVCPSRDVGEALAKQRLEQLAAALGVPLTDIFIAKGASNEATGLTEFTISFGAEAQYDALLNFLDALGKSRPEVFVDTADLTPNVSVASLKLTGRVLCWTVARQ